MFAKNSYFLFFWYLFFAKWFQTEKQLFGIPKLFNSQYREKNYGYAIITAELVAKIFYFWKKKIENFEFFIKSYEKWNQNLQTFPQDFSKDLWKM